MDLSNENYYDKFEAFKIVASTAKFKNQTCVLLTFVSINEYKAKNRLLGMHTRMISKFVVNNTSRMEKLHSNLLNGDFDDKFDELSELIGEFIGSAQVTLNMVQ